MDAACQTIISQLREIRANLKEALVNADSFEYKLLGPRPSDTKGDAPKPAECVASLLGDISRLSVAAKQFTQRHHEIFGDFGGEQCANAGAPARYAQ